MSPVQRLLLKKKAVLFLFVGGGRHALRENERCTPSARPRGILFRARWEGQKVNGIPVVGIWNTFYQANVKGSVTRRRRIHLHAISVVVVRR